MAHRLLIILLTLCLVACEQSAATREHVRIGSDDWSLELAVGDAAIQRGMMGRETIPRGTGMLFVFSEPVIHQFWMANCLIDIDVIFLDGQGRVTTMYRMVTEPPRRAEESQLQYEQRLPLYSSRVPVRFAIELPAGSIDALALRVGDAVPIAIDRLKSLSR
ncbi:MAG: DUF192 domain-containing protein [Phycisphaerales bacterium]|nr:DUF192 domain-containing protein [Phycisphaerales bacterium]